MTALARVKLQLFKDFGNANSSTRGLVCTHACGVPHVEHWAIRGTGARLVWGQPGRLTHRSAWARCFTGNAAVLLGRPGAAADELIRRIAVLPGYIRTA